VLYSKKLNHLSVMAQQLKRWESPRRQGRNDKGRGGSARQRQLKKREKMLRKRLKAQNPNSNTQGGDEMSPPFWLLGVGCWVLVVGNSL
jgi:hypothetical protein